MAVMSARSRRELASCHQDLRRLFEACADEGLDFDVICGHRGQPAQDVAFAEGRSKLRWPLSAHNSTPSRAADVTPRPLNWKDVKSFKALGAKVKMVAEKIGVDVVWGGDFKSWKDFPHWERLYRVWQDMRRRCYDSNREQFYLYGGRGITVCDSWRADYVPFREWAMANGVRDDLTLDRIDVDGNYSPENCRWVDKKTQARNRRSNRRITVNGETKTIAEWSELTGLSANVIYHRLKSGWIDAQVVTPMRVVIKRGALMCPHCGKVVQ